MSERRTIWWSKDCHLYTDYLDSSGGAHGYLRIGSNLVKRIVVETTPEDFAVTIRLPAQTFRMLRPDPARYLKRAGRAFDGRERPRSLRMLCRLPRSPAQKNSSEATSRTQDPSRSRP